MRFHHIRSVTTFIPGEISGTVEALFRAEGGQELEAVIPVAVFTPIHNRGYATDVELAPYTRSGEQQQLVLEPLPGHDNLYVEDEAETEQQPSSPTESTEPPVEGPDATEQDPAPEA